MTFGEWLWAIFVFFIWIEVIWIFIRIFADIFRRRDLSGVAKAGWILVLVIVPFLSALIYMIVRPKMTEQDREDIQRAREAQRRFVRHIACRGDREAREAPRLGSHHGRRVRAPQGS